MGLWKFNDADKAGSLTSIGPTLCGAQKTSFGKNGKIRGAAETGEAPRRNRESSRELDTA